MFLNQLSYQEKKMFLDLSIHVAKANDELAANEKAMISEYCTEMQLPPIELYETEPFGTTIDYFALAEEKIKKIVLLELLGLAYVDGTYDESELKLIKKYTEAVGIDEDSYAKINTAIQSYYKVCAELAQTIE